MTAAPASPLDWQGLAWPRLRYFVGCDLGQARDPSAVCVVERATWPNDGDVSSMRSEGRALRQEFGVRHLERLPLNVSYAAQASHVARMMGTAPLRDGATLVIDATGVGRAVLELFRKAGLQPIPLTITAGDSFTRSAIEWRVSKLALTSRLQAMLHAGDVKIAAELKERSALVAELADFRVNWTDAGNATFGARSGRHDDLVLATAIALFVASEETRGAARVTKMF